LTPLYYSRAAFRTLAALPKAQQAAVRRCADALGVSTDRSAVIRALPGGLDRDLAQVAVEGVGRLVCRISELRIDVLAIMAHDHSLPPSARRDAGQGTTAA